MLVTALLLGGMLQDTFFSTDFKLEPLRISSKNGIIAQVQKHCLHKFFNAHTLLFLLPHIP